MAPVWSLLVAQAAVTLPPPADFDLARVQPAEPRCGGPSADTIVVCAPKAMDIIVADAGALVPEPVRAETGLAGGGTLGGRVEQRRNAPPAVMIGLKLPF